MRELVYTKKFEKDYKRTLRRGFDPRKLSDVLDLLVADKPLPARCRPHKLSGNLEGTWECHIAPDTLLLYEYGEDTLMLLRLGSHADLFE